MGIVVVMLLYIPCHVTFALSLTVFCSHLEKSSKCCFPNFLQCLESDFSSSDTC